MDAKEALKQFDSYHQSGFSKSETPNSAVLLFAIMAIKKQIPKEPIFDSGNRLCGECREIIKAYESHCPFCGQAIKKE